MTANEKALIAVDALEDKKAEGITILDISEVSVMADYFIIAHGNNANQVQAIIDNVEEKLGRNGVKPMQIEGYHNANWILIDYEDVVIHVFDKENRFFYDLERIWKDGKNIDKADLQ